MTGGTTVGASQQDKREGVNVTIHAENTTIHAASVAIALLLPLPDMVPDQYSEAALRIKYRLKILEIVQIADCSFVDCRL